MTSVFRPRFGVGLAVAVIALCAGALLASVIHDGPSAWWTVGPWAALVGVAIWAVYINPRVVVDDAGVHLVNVTRTVDVPWPAITAIDTKWSLTLVTAYGRFTAWAAPAPGGLAAARAAGRGRRHQDDAVSQHEARPGLDRVRAGDLVGSPSGSAAAAIAERLDMLRQAGHLDDPRLETPRAPIRWHWPMIAGVAALAVLSALSVVTG